MKRFERLKSYTVNWGVFCAVAASSLSSHAFLQVPDRHDQGAYSVSWDYRDKADGLMLKEVGPNGETLISSGLHGQVSRLKSEGLYTYKLYKCDSTSSGFTGGCPFVLAEQKSIEVADSNNTRLGCAVGDAFRPYSAYMQWAIDNEPLVSAASIAVGVGLGEQARVVYSRGFGELEPGLATPRDAIFRLASLSKPFAYYGIEKLVELSVTNPATGLALRFDDLVAPILAIATYPDGRNVVSGSPADSRFSNIRIQDLIHHKSGVRGPGVSVEDTVAWIYEQPLYFAPGSEYSYSNGGYILLRFLIDYLSRSEYQTSRPDYAGIEKFFQNALLAQIGTTDIFQAFGPQALRLRDEEGKLREPAIYNGSVLEANDHAEYEFDLMSSAETVVKFFQREDVFEVSSEVGYRTANGWAPTGGREASGRMGGSAAYIVKGYLADGKTVGTAAALFNGNYLGTSPTVPAKLRELLSLTSVESVDQFNTPHIGVVRNGTWIVDSDNNKRMTGSDSRFNFGSAGSKPTVLKGAGCENNGLARVANVDGNKWHIGELSHKVGSTNFGVQSQPLSHAGRMVSFFNNRFYVDVNDNQKWDQGIDSGDYFFPSGQSGASFIPVIGRWVMDAQFSYPTAFPYISTEEKYGALSRFALFKDGNWYYDSDNNGVWNTGDRWSQFGSPGDIPFAADFDNDGLDEIGVFRNGTWYIDMNGSGGWDAGDVRWQFGQAGDVPVISPTAWRTADPSEWREIN